MAALAAVAVLARFALAYRFYARWIGDRVYADSEALETSAHSRQDGRDFVPTPRDVLFGHHITSIAGSAPIIGPCVAAHWGWPPALARVVMGTIVPSQGVVSDLSWATYLGFAAVLVALTAWMLAEGALRHAAAPSCGRPTGRLATPPPVVEGAANRPVTCSTR